MVNTEELILLIRNLNCWMRKKFYKSFVLGEKLHGIDRSKEQFFHCSLLMLCSHKILFVVSHHGYNKKSVPFEESLCFFSCY